MSSSSSTESATAGAVAHLPREAGVKLELPVSYQPYFNDGSVAFFSKSAPRYPNEIVQMVLSGKIRRAEVRYPSGALVIVKRRGGQ